MKTLSPRRPDPGYAATRAFYFGCGFRPLEEMPDAVGAGPAGAADDQDRPTAGTLRARRPVSGPKTW